MFIPSLIHWKILDAPGIIFEAFLGSFWEILEEISEGIQQEFLEESRMNSWRNPGGIPGSITEEFLEESR